MRLIALFAVLALSSADLALQQVSAKPVLTDAQVIAQQLPSYPLDTCPISKEKLGGAMGAPMDVVQDGRLVRFCCKDCVAEFKKDPAPVLKTIDAAVVKAQVASYPLTTCPISGEPLTANGAPIDFVNGTRLVRFCCPKCIDAFKKDPATTIAKVDAALIAAQKKIYTATTCPISGQKIEADGVDYLYGTRLVRFCCPKCPDAFLKDPAKALMKLDAAKGTLPATAPGEKIEKKSGY